MAPIPLKCVISVSSEDPLNPASNLLGVNCTTSKKWLCTRDNKTRRSEVIVELAKKSRITTLEIGNFGSAFVEVLVSNTDSSRDDYITLLPSSMLMTIPDSKAGRSKTASLRYGKERLSLTAMSKKWNVVKIKCCQKYNITEQFGLQHLAFFSDTPTSQTPLKHTSTTHTLTSPRTPHTPMSPSGHSTPTTPRHRIPSLPGSKHSISSEHAQKSKNGTSKRALREKPVFDDQEEDYEFAGIERQSRLFKNCVREKPSNDTKDDEPNSILSRITSEKKKYSEKLNTTPACSYQRTKLLKKEIPKAKGLVDFAETYKQDDCKKGPNVGGAFGRLSAFDNELEIGQEPEVKWGRKKHKRPKKHPRSVAPKGWLNKKRKIDDLISECEALAKRTIDDRPDNSPTKENTPLTLDDIKADTDKKLADIQEVDSDDTKSYSWSGSEKGTDASHIECPVCGVLQPAYAIEVHASTCGDEPIVVVPSNSFEPICID